MPVFLYNKYNTRPLIHWLDLSHNLLLFLFQNTSCYSFVFFYFVDLFQQLQEEKKKTKVFKKAFMGPFIRFHSTSMPVEPKIQEVDVNVEKVEQSQSGYVHVKLQYISQTDFFVYFAHGWWALRRSLCVM